MNPIRLAFTLILPAVLVGCSKGTAPLSPVAHSSAGAGNPSKPSRAVPFDDFVVPLFWGGTPRDGLAMAVGYENTIEDICENHTLLTSAGLGVQVFTGSGRIPIVTTTRDAKVVVFRYGGGIVTDPCLQVLGAPIVATGRVQYSVQATDISGLAGLGPGAFGVYASVQGVVDLTAGGQARLSGRLRFQGAPDGSIFADEEVVTLTPL